MNTGLLPPLTSSTSAAPQVLTARWAVTVWRTLAASAEDTAFRAGVLAAGEVAACATPELMAQPRIPAAAPPMTPRLDSAESPADLVSRARHSAASSRTIVPDRRQPTRAARRP